MTFGQRIGMLRTERKWSQMYLGLEADLSQTTIYQYEAGRIKLPRMDSLSRLSKAFDMTINQLLEGVEFK